MYYDNREQLLAIDGTAPIDYKWRRRGDDIFVVTIPEVDGVQPTSQLDCIIPC